MYLVQAEKEREEYQKAKEGMNILITDCMAFWYEEGLKKILYDKW